MGDSDLRLAEMWPHPPEAQCRIIEKHERLWVVHQDLIDAGYLNLEDFSVVRINERFYELQGHTTAGFRLIGEHHPNGIWWIEPLEDEEA